jgi:hypothetical protein
MATATEPKVSNANRIQELRRAADCMIAEHSAWSGDKNRPSIDQPLNDAIVGRNCDGSLLEIFSEGDIPDECKALHTAAMKFIAEYQDWLGDKARMKKQSGSYKLWEAFEGFKRARHSQAAPVQAKRAYRESIEELKAQKVGVPQIARIWRIQPWQVEAYLRTKPDGSREWDFPKGWQHPDDAKAEAQAVDYTAKVLAMEDRLARAQSQASRERKPIDDAEQMQLCSENVPIHQIARMARMSVGELTDKIKEKGWHMPSAAGDPLVAEIQKYSNQGYSNIEIAKHENVPAGVVAEALAKPLLKRGPAAKGE